VFYVLSRVRSSAGSAFDVVHFRCRPAATVEPGFAQAAGAFADGFADLLGYGLASHTAVTASLRQVLLTIGNLVIVLGSE